MTGWDEVSAFALALPGTEASTSYGKPAIKVAANGRAFVATSGEPDSFVLMIDADSKAVLLETDPDTFWQTPHYEGWASLLVRYAGKDPERVQAVIERARDQAAVRKSVKPRKA